MSATWLPGGNLCLQEDERVLWAWFELKGRSPAQSRLKTTEVKMGDYEINM